MQRNKFLGVAVSAGLAVTVLGACGGGSSKSAGSSGGGILSQTKTSTPASAPTSASSGSTGSVSSGSNPTGTVTGAIKKVGDSSGVTLTLSVQGSPSDFPGETGVSSTQLSAILKSQLIISTHTSNGKSLTASAQTPGGSQGDFEIQLLPSSNAKALADLRVIDNKTLYAQVDIAGTSSNYGLQSGEGAKAQQELQAASAEIPGLDALGKGSWVSIDLTPLVQLEKQSAATSTTTAGSAGVTPASEAALASAFFKAFEQNSQITNLGSENGGTEYQAVVREKALVESLGAATQSIPGFGSDATKLNGSNIPATQTVTVDVVIKDGTLSELQLPLKQFDTNNKITGTPYLDLVISGSDAINVPPAPTAINLAPLLSELGSSSSSS